MPCEHRFSSGGEIATDRHSHLGAERFEEIQILKHSWCRGIIDRADLNSVWSEKVAMNEYQELFVIDEELAELDKKSMEVVEV
jgi:hypothetical protein